MDFQVLSKFKTDEEKFVALSKTTFLAEYVTNDLTLHLTNYFDAVKEQAAILCDLIIQRFLPFEHPADESKTTDMIATLRAQLQMGWSTKLSQPLKDMAEVEVQLIPWLFEDASAFLRQVITTYMDEPPTRQILSHFIKKINKSLPFLLFNDLRLANANNSLQRMQVVKGLIANKMIE